MPKPEFAIIECERPTKEQQWCTLAEFLPDGKTVVGFVSGQFSGPALLAQWDAESGKLLKTAGEIPYAPMLESWVSPDRRLMAIVQSTTVLTNPDWQEKKENVRYENVGSTYIADTATLTIRVLLPYPAREAAFSSDGELLAVQDPGKTIRILKLKTNQELATRPTSDTVSMLAFRHQQPELTIIDGDTVTTWKFSTGKEQKGVKVPGMKHQVSPDGGHLVYTSGTYKQGSPIIMDTVSWKARKASFCGEVRHCSLSPDASKLAIAADKMLVIWDLIGDSAWLKWKKPHFNDIRHAAFSPDGQRVACIMNHGQVHIFDFRTGAKDHLVERPKLKAGEHYCLRMVGGDDQMDGDSYTPLNALPVKCPTCKFEDIDFVPNPYLLSRKTESPADMDAAQFGNLLVRESMKHLLEVAAPGQCKFYPTIHKKTKQPTAWFLAVPQKFEVTDVARPEKCPQCGEPYNYKWEDKEAMASPNSKHDVFKSLNWLSGNFDEFKKWGEAREGVDRYLYFSVRLEALVKKAGRRGLVRSYDCRQEPTAEDLAWVNEKLNLLNKTKSAGTSADDGGEVAAWFKDYLQKKAKVKAAACDFAAVEKLLKFKLPETYKKFITATGSKSYNNIDGEEGFRATILPPKKLIMEDCCEEGADETEAFKGIMFAVTDHGDAFYFDTSRGKPDYEVRKHDHEVGSFEPYTKNFAGCIKRFAGG